MGENKVQRIYYLFKRKVGREPKRMFLSSRHQPETFPSHRLLYKLTQAGLEVPTTQFRSQGPKNEKLLFKMLGFWPLA